MKPMRVYGRHVARFVSIAVFATLGLGCATMPPPELVQARQAYERSSLGPASELAPAEVHKAKASLDKAEEAFADKPSSQKTRDLSYVAERKAQLADAIGEYRRSDRTRQQAEREYLTKQQQMAQHTTEALANTRGELADTERSRKAGAKALGAEHTARIGAEAKADEYEQRAHEASDALAKLAATKEEARGLVITLSGSVLFATNQSTLLPTAQTRLNQVSTALMATKERSLIVEGHTDSQGTASYNLALSQRRADAVRSYLISRGYPATRIRAQGIGKDRPVTENRSAEGRANNRRVEIVVEPKLKASL
jgi:outer membrane protein OmpA-like peptidoglycan-associated protein